MVRKLLLNLVSLAVMQLLLGIEPQVMAKNLLLNPGFEDDWHKAESGNGYVADGWRDFQVEGGVEYRDEPQRAWIHNGNHAQRWWSSGGTHDVGILQTVPVAKGEIYAAKAWFYNNVSSNIPDNYQCRIGLDPTGGNDPKSLNIIWSPWADTIEDEWRPIWITSVKASRDQMTIFLEGKALWNQEINLCVVDDVVLAPTSDLTTFTPEEQLYIIIADIPANWWASPWYKVPQLEEFISSNPKEPSLCARSQYLIGNSYYSQRRHSDALTSYEKVIKGYPNETQWVSSARFERGEIYYKILVDYEKALHEYKEAATISGDLALLQRSINIILSMKGNKMAEAALSLLNTMEENFPKTMSTIPGLIIKAESLSKFASRLPTTTEAERELRRAKFEGSLRCYREAYLSCAVSDTKSFKVIIDGIVRTLKDMDMSLGRASQFLQYQLYGPHGRDGKAGTRDDLINPLADF